MSACLALAPFLPLAEIAPSRLPGARPRSGVWSSSSLAFLPMDFDRLSDEELIERGRRPGSEAALAVLYERYHAKVAAWCLRLSGDRQEAADLAQEVFLRVH